MVLFCVFEMRYKHRLRANRLIVGLVLFLAADTTLHKEATQSHKDQTRFFNLIYINFTIGLTCGCGLLATSKIICETILHDLYNPDKT